LTRVIPLAVQLPVFVLQALLPWRTRSWRWLFAAAGTTLAVVAVVAVNNGLRSGMWTMSTGTGRHLYNHFVYQQKLWDPNGEKTRELVAKLPGRDLPNCPHWEVTRTLEESYQCEHLFVPVALEAARTASIAEHVAFNARLTWANLSKTAAESMVIEDQTRGAHPAFAHDPLRVDSVPGSLLLSRCREFTRRVWYVLCLSFVASLAATLLLREGRVEWLVWIWTVWGYMILSSAVEYELPRYHAAVAPMVTMLGVATVGVVVRALWRHRPSGPRPDPAVQDPAVD
jgi:hypothetical protein